MAHKKNEIPDHWRWVTLDDIGIIVSGGTPSTKEPEFWGDEISWVTPADLSNHNDIYISSGQRGLSKVGLEYSSAKLLPKNSIIFSTRAPIGYVAIAKNELATNQGFKNLIIFEKFINPKYGYYYLKTIKELAENMASGTTFLELSSSKFKKIPFPFSPIEEQNRVVEKIEELFSELEYAKKNLDEAFEKLDLTFHKAINNYFKTDNGTEYHLSDVADWGTGGTPSRKKPEYFKGNIPWVKTQELKSKYINETEEYLTELGLANSNAKIHPKGSVVIAMYGATAGKLSILNIDASTNQACAVGTVNPFLLNNEYLYYLLFSKKDELIAKAKGGAQQNISLGIIKDYRIIIPAIDEQNTILLKIESLNLEIDRQKINLKKEIGKLNTLKQKILQEAFGGKLTSSFKQDSHINILLKDLQIEKDNYLSNSMILQKNKLKIKRKEVDLYGIIKSEFKDKLFSYLELSKVAKLSEESLSADFNKIEGEKLIIKIFDKESGSIKYKLA
ncbi:type I restriction endonuclease MjaXP subunit S [Bacteroidia bacterium]|nr:type I restriction endonuclease MjaXP subunit S [Bacteroidia bacterium]